MQADSSSKTKCNLDVVFTETLYPLTDFLKDRVKRLTASSTHCQASYHYVCKKKGNNAAVQREDEAFCVDIANMTCSYRPL